jgi:hypothetical protein
MNACAALRSTQAGQHWQCIGALVTHRPSAEEMDVQYGIGLTFCWEALA